MLHDMSLRYFLDGIADGAPDFDLETAVAQMDGLKFWHGEAKSSKTFSLNLVRMKLKLCVTWAESKAPEDARASAGVQPLAAIRAWTGEAVCYVVTSLLRDKERTKETVAPVKEVFTSCPTPVLGRAKSAVTIEA